jgi:WD40 repeat protein
MLATLKDSALLRRSCLALALGLACLGLALADDEGEKPAKPADVLATLAGHTETVYGITFTPDGKHVVTASFDHTLKLWDASTAKEIKTFGGPNGHRDMVVTLALSRDGTRLASGGQDNLLKVWDVPTSKAVHDFAQKAQSLGVALSPDGTKLAGAGKDGALVVWNAADGKELFRLKGGHTKAAACVAFNNNGQMLMSGGEDHTVCFWNATNGQLLGTLYGHRAAVHAVAFHPNGAAAYSADGAGRLRFWQLPLTAPVRLPAHGDTVTSLALSNDGNQAVTGGLDKVVRVVNTGNGQQARQLTGADAAVHSVALAPNNALIAAGTADHHLVLWNNSAPAPVARLLAHGGAVNALAFHSASNQLLTGGADGGLKLWTLPPAAPRSLKHAAAVLSATLSSDGNRLVTGGGDKVVRSWNVGNSQMERQFTGHASPVTAVALSANGQALASGGGSTIRFWNQNNAQQAGLIGAHEKALTSLVFHPSGNQILSASADGTLKLWRLPLTAPTLAAHPDQVTGAALSPDGNKLLTGCKDKQVRLWNLANGQVERTLGGTTLAVTCVAFDPKGVYVVAGGADKSLTVWKAADGAQVKRLASLAAVPNAIAISPDGKTLAAGFADNSVRLYDIVQGKEVKSLTGHKGAVNALVYTPKGDLIVTAGADKTVRKWSAADGSDKGVIEAGTVVHCLALDKDGVRVAAGGTDKKVQVWTLADGKSAASFATPAEVHAVGLSADGKKVVAGGADGRTRIYGTDGKLQEFFVQEGDVVAAIFHGDGKRVLTAGADKTARAWTTALAWQAAASGPASQALFTPKGDQVMSAGTKTVQLWNADGKPVRSIAAHDGAVRGIALSTDGNRLVSAGADKTIKVWSLAPPKPGAKVEKKVEKAEEPLAVIKLTGEPEGLTLSPNGTQIAVAVAGKTAHTVHVHDAATGKELVAFDHTAAVRALAFRSDNRTLVVAGDGKEALLLDLPPVKLLEGHAGGVTAVAFHNSGTQAVTAGADKTVKLLDLNKGTVTRTFGKLDAAVSAVAFSRDYSQVAAAAGKTVKVWNFADGKEVATITHPSAVHSLSYSGDRTRLVTAAADGYARVWETATGRLLQSFRHEGALRAVAFHPNNTRVLAAGADKTPVVHALAVTRVIVASDKPVRALAVTPSQSHVLTAGDDKKVQLWNLGNGARERTFEGATDALRSVAVAPNSVLVAAAGADKKVRLYQLGDAKLVGTIKAPGEVRALAFSPNSVVLAAACGKAVSAWGVRYNQGQPPPEDFGSSLQSFAHADEATGVVFAPNSVTLYSSGLDKSVKSWKLAADAPVQNYGHPGRVDSVAFSPNGESVASGCTDGSVRIYDLAGKKQPVTIVAHRVTQPQAENFPIYCIVWSPDGKQVLSGSKDGSMKLWNAANGQLVREFKAYNEKTFPKGHREGVYCAAFNKDGTQIVSGSSDRTIKVWKVADGSVVRQFSHPKLKAEPGETAAPSHPGWVYGLCFTADGKKVISVGNAPVYKGYLAVWNLADGKLLHSQEYALGSFNAVALAPDGKTLAVACSPQGQEYTKVESYLLKAPKTALPQAEEKAEAK